MKVDKKVAVKAVVSAVYCPKEGLKLVPYPECYGCVYFVEKKEGFVECRFEEW
jgi:hypothetical protein